MGADLRSMQAFRLGRTVSSRPSLRDALAGGWSDAAIALAMTAYVELEYLGDHARYVPAPVLAVALATMTSALAWRRRWPLAFVTWSIGWAVLISVLLAPVSASTSTAYLLLVCPY